MSFGVLIVLIVATFFNIIIIRHNFRKERYQNIVVDVGIIFGLSYLFGGTLGGMAIATAVSALFSIHIMFKPVNIGGTNEVH